MDTLWSRFELERRHIAFRAGVQTSDGMPNGHTGCKTRDKMGFLAATLHVRTHVLPFKVALCLLAYVSRFPYLTCLFCERQKLHCALH